MRTLRFRDMSEESTFDLNLAPMMDMLVSIIPFMLLSATFLQVLVISVPLPQSVTKALSEDRAKVERDITIMVAMDKDSGFTLELKDENKKSTRLFIHGITEGKNHEFDYKTLHRRLVEMKQKYPKIFRIELNPDSAIPYSSIVKTMDTSRLMENADPRVLIEGAETPLLFPDVVLANIMG